MAQIDHVIADSATDGYELRNTQQIQRFLQDHDYLLPLLLEIKQRIVAYFPDAPLALEVANNPESTGDEQLIAIITESAAPEDVFDRLEQFDREWWIGAVRSAQGKLCITAEFA
jgi:hypothetical protein